jgi:hypothetical protein
MGTRKVNSASFTSESGREAQKRSAEVRRAHSEERRSAKEFARAALNAEVTDKSTGKKVIIKDAIIQKLVAKAIQDSDLQTVKYLFELIGENPSQKVEVSGELRNAFNIVVKNEEDKELLKGLKDL